VIQTKLGFSKQNFTASLIWLQSQSGISYIFSGGETNLRLNMAQETKKLKKLNSVACIKKVKKSKAIPATGREGP
jgi:hypothetical protein